MMQLEEIDTITSVCPNCSKDVSGNYCQHCGERAPHNKPDLRLTHFLKEAYHELFDLDSKLLRTVKTLLLKPGFLTLESLQGKRSLYIRPFRLYVTMVVVHFLAFSLFQSGDIFNIDRLPLLNMAPTLKQEIQQRATASELSSDEFTSVLSNRVKDNLTITLYVVVFLAGAILKLIFPSVKRYYVEHLQFVFHIFSFAFVRNVLLIPLIMLGLDKLVVVFVLVTQVIYSFVAMRKVYGESFPATLMKMAMLFVSIVAMFYVSLYVCVYIAFWQIG